MKIEKINDNQIRCTLTREDLENHQIRLSELAYGTEKAKSLFRDMMQQAHAQFGFEADNIPLMIEAIPLNSESILLIITKVEDPEELDTRFSKFAPSAGNNDAVYLPFSRFGHHHRGRAQSKSFLSRDQRPLQRLKKRRLPVSGAPIFLHAGRIQ